MAELGKIFVVRVSVIDYSIGLDPFSHSLFVTPQWIGAVERQGKDALYLHFVKNNVVVAKLAGIVEVGSRFAKRFLFLYAGPALVVNDRELYDNCMEALYGFARNNGISKIDMRNYDMQHNWVCRANGFFKRGMPEFVKHFNAEEQTPKFSKSIMYNVRKAQRVNAEFREETSERLLNKLHELLEATAQLRADRYGNHYVPYPYHLMTKESTNRLFHSGLMRLFSVTVDGEIHCVRCAIENNKRMFGLMIAADAFAYKNGLQHFMQYNIINSLHTQGYSYYNIAGTSPLDEGPGLAEYKQSLGCMPQNTYGVYTRYITFPQNIVNPVMNVGRLVGRNERLQKLAYHVSMFLTTGHWEVV
jgi:hypothetical protein